MPAKQRLGSPLVNESNDDKIELTKSELNDMISSAVRAAIIASVDAPARPVVKESNPRLALEQDFNNRMLKNNLLAKVLTDEKKVAYSIPSIYSSYVASVTASINGLTVKIPANGKTYQIPERFVPIIAQYIENIDRKVAAMETTAEIGQYGGIAELRGAF